MARQQLRKVVSCKLMALASGNGTQSPLQELPEGCQEVLDTATSSNPRRQSQIG